MARRKREAADHARRQPSDVDVETAALERLAGESIARALATLPDRERDAIVLAYFGDHTYREVANMLGIPEGTLKSRIRHGLADLRVQLMDRDDDDMAWRVRNAREHSLPSGPRKQT